MIRFLLPALLLGLLFLSGETEAARRSRARRPAPVATTHPSRLVFRDDFESYPNSATFWLRGGQHLDRWKRDPGPKGWIDLLLGGPRKAGKGSVGIEIGGDGRQARQSVLFYRVPLERVQRLRRVGFEGWVSAEMLEGNRLLLQLQRWEGGQDGLRAAGALFDGASSVWHCQSPSGAGAFVPFTGPVVLPSDRDRFSYFKLVVDWPSGRYHSFRLNDKTWDLSSMPVMPVQPQAVHRLLQPMLELDVRLLCSTGRSFCSRAFVDDLAITSED